MAQYTVKHGWSDQFVGILDIQGDQVTVLHEAVEGLLTPFVADAKVYGAEAAMSKWDNTVFEPYVGNAVVKDAGIEAHGEVSKVDEDPVDPTIDDARRARPAVRRRR